MATISNVSGTWGLGNTLTIACSGAGTKTRSKPYIWADFQDGTVNPHASLSSQTTWSVEKTEATTDGPRWGTYAAKSNWTASSWSCTFSPASLSATYGTKMYIGFWRKATYDLAGNWKWMRIWKGSAGSYPNVYLGDSDSSDTANRLWYVEDGTPVTGTNRKYYSGYPVPTSTWRFEEFIIQLNGSQAAVDGSIDILINNSSVGSDSNFQYDTATRPGHINKIYVQDTKSGSTNPNGHAWRSDVYIDDSWHRIVLGNAATYSSCTHLEVQPYTSWANTQVNINLRPGTFSVASGTYLFIVDSNNSPSSGFNLSGLGSNPPPTLDSISPTSGPAAGGTTVTFLGSSYVATPSVKFGGVDATAEHLTSESQIEAVTPAGTGTVDVLLTNPDLGNVTLTGGYTYVAAPTFTGVDPAVGTTDGGTGLQIVGTGFQVGATVSVGGVACTGVSVDSSTNISCLTGAHAAGVVDLIITNTDTQAVTGTGAYEYQTPDAPPAGGFTFIKRCMMGLG